MGSSCSAFSDHEVQQGMQALKRQNAHKKLVVESLPEVPAGNVSSRILKKYPTMTSLDGEGGELGAQAIIPRQKSQEVPGEPPELIIHRQGTSRQLDVHGESVLATLEPRAIRKQNTQSDLEETPGLETPPSIQKQPTTRALLVMGTGSSIIEEQAAGGSPLASKAPLIAPIVRASSKYKKHGDGMELGRSPRKTQPGYGAESGPAQQAADGTEPESKAGLLRGGSLSALIKGFTMPKSGADGEKQEGERMKKNLIRMASLSELKEKSLSRVGSIQAMLKKIMTEEEEVDAQTRASKTKKLKSWMAGAEDRDEEDDPEPKGGILRTGNLKTMFSRGVEEEEEGIEGWGDEEAEFAARQMAQKRVLLAKNVDVPTEHDKEMRRIREREELERERENEEREAREEREKELREELERQHAEELQSEDAYGYQDAEDKGDAEGDNGRPQHRGKADDGVEFGSLGDRGSEEVRKQDPQSDQSNDMLAYSWGGVEPKVPNKYKRHGMRRENFQKLEYGSWVKDATGFLDQDYRAKADEAATKNDALDVSLYSSKTLNEYGKHELNQFVDRTISSENTVDQAPKSRNLARESKLLRANSEIIRGYEKRYLNRDSGNQPEFRRPIRVGAIEDPKWWDKSKAAASLSRMRETYHHVLETESTNSSASSLAYRPPSPESDTPKSPARRHHALQDMTRGNFQWLDKKMKASWVTRQLHTQNQFSTTPPQKADEQNSNMRHTYKDTDLSAAIAQGRSQSERKLPNRPLYGNGSAKLEKRRSRLASALKQ